MKVTNWCKGLRVTLLATGVLAPGAAYAQVIPLGDPSFEAYTVPARGYAYAANPNGAYRPTSPWIDDLDNPPGYTQDNTISNWLYTGAYAESTTFTKRPAPRTGGQAMHGLYNYSAQETSTLFEANKSYTFSVWAQNDELLNETNGVFLYIFDTTVPFSDANALSGQLFTAINQRQTGMTAVQSQANWTQISLQHNVLPGAPEVGHPIGVAFYGRKDSAVDDAALVAAPIDPALLVVFLEVNTTNGQVTMKNQTGQPVDIDYYEILSNNGNGNSLNASSWNSLQDPTANAGQDLNEFPRGDGSGNGWEEAGGSDDGVLAESYLTGDSAVPHSMAGGISLGAAFRPGFAQNLVFRYGEVEDPVAPPGDFNGDLVVDAGDYPVWRKSVGTPQELDYDEWVANFGATASSPPSTLVQGFVRYVTSGSGGGGGVPEPSTVLLVGIGLASLALGGRRKIEEG